MQPVRVAKEAHDSVWGFLEAGYVCQGRRQHACGSPYDARSLSPGSGFAAVQFLAWIKGMELADHLAYSAEHLVASHTEQLEETWEISHDVIRDGVYNLAWWSRLLTTLVMLRLIF